MNMYGRDMSLSIRPPAVAGAFYPGEPGRLRAVVDGLLAEAADRSREPLPAPKAVIAPHAGYIYSGAVAAAAYHRARAAEATIRRVVLLGPAHRVALDGFAVPSVTSFLTPLGEIPLDRAAIHGLLRDRADVAERDDAHAAEHSLEVHLPFLQRALGPFRLVPVVVGEAGPDAVAALLRQLWGGDETLVVISTDLSHYHDYDTARTIDDETAGLIERLAVGSFGPYEACGARPVNGLLRVAGELGFRVTRLGVCNSGDTAGPRDHVVGYGAWALGPAEASRVAPSHRELLLDTAARALSAQLRHGRRSDIAPDSFPFELRSVAASFVTLSIDGELRGCVGTLDAYRPLVADVAWNAVSAGFEDPRFSPLATDELRRTEIEIAVLSTPAPLAFDDEAHLMAQLRPNVDGLILESGGRRSTFLPKVWRSLPSPDAFLDGLRRKAGLPRGFWSDDDIRVWRYVAESFGGPLPARILEAGAP